MTLKTNRRQDTMSEWCLVPAEGGGPVKSLQVFDR